MKNSSVCQHCKLLKNFLVPAILDKLVKSQTLPVFVIPAKLVLDLIGERESREIIPGGPGLPRSRE